MPFRTVGAVAVAAMVTGPVLVAAVVLVVLDHVRDALTAVGVDELSDNERTQLYAALNTWRDGA